MANIAESPRIFRGTESSTVLPNLEIKNGQLLIDSSFVAEGARLGPYDVVMDFGTSRAGLRGLVPQEQRLSGDSDNLMVLGFKQPLIREAMSTLTDLANDPSRSSENSDDRHAYRTALKRVYQEMAVEVDDWAGNKKALVFAPKNGGIFVQEVFEEMGFPPSDFLNYRMSRVQKNDSGLIVGTTFGVNNPRITDYRKFVFADDCMASDISAFATMEIIKEALAKANVPLSEAEVLIAVSAATQRGLESLLSQSTKDYFGFGSIKAVAGMPVYKMDSHFYLQHPDDRYVVGDMGNWTQPPTA